MPDFIVVSGMSGAGRSQVGDTLEDLDWFVIDNLPAALIPPVAELALRPGSDTPRVALVLGAPRASRAAEVVEAVDSLRRLGATVQLLFLDASDEVLIRRYESSKRRHPSDGVADGLAEAIRAERAAFEPLREVADLVIDTSALNVHQLRALISEQVGGETGDMRISIVSFGYKNGLPSDVDMVFDCRFLPNPYWVEDLRPLTGRDSAVQEYLDAEPDTKRFLDELHRMFDFLVPRYAAERRAYLTIAFGCTGGRHRSVRIAEAVADHMRADGRRVRLVHRDTP